MDVVLWAQLPNTEARVVNGIRTQLTTTDRSKITNWEFYNFDSDINVYNHFMNTIASLETLFDESLNPFKI